MHHASPPRFRRGQRVNKLYDPSAGVGVVQRVGLESIIIYLGRNEWVTEFTRFATVKFEHGSEDVVLDDLVSSTRVELYNSLRPGDLIVFGQKKRARGLVLCVCQRRKRGSFVTDRRVIIIEDGVRKQLSLGFEIISVKRVLNEC